MILFLSFLQYVSPLIMLFLGWLLIEVCIGPLKPYFYRLPSPLRSIILIHFFYAVAFLCAFTLLRGVHIAVIGTTVLLEAVGLFLTYED